MSYATSVVKSIQRGTINHLSSGTSYTATITSVDASKSLISYSGNRTEQTAVNKALVTLYLTDATTVTVEMATAPDNSNGRTTYQVVEYY
jgi:hypothetical protein